MGRARIGRLDIDELAVRRLRIARELGRRGMTALPLRLNPGADLRESLEAELAARACSAAFVVSAIGSLSVARLRFAGAREPVELSGDLEILTLAGSVAVNGSHLHISVADAQGRVTGGHVAKAGVVRTTAEVLLALLPGWSFRREPDPATGFDELVVSQPNPGMKGKTA